MSHYMLAALSDRLHHSLGEGPDRALRFLAELPATFSGNELRRVGEGLGFGGADVADLLGALVHAGLLAHSGDGFVKPGAQALAA